MLRLITLKGRLTGSAVLTIGENATGIELRCRKLRQLSADGPFGVYLVSENALKRAEMDGANGKAEPIDAKAVLIADGEGRIIAEGANELPEAALDKAKTTVRQLFFAETSCARQKTNARTETGKAKALNNGPAVISGIGAGAPASPVTRSILDSAKQLFERKQPEPGKPAGSTANQAAPPETEQPRRSPNPFPRTLPGAVWLNSASDGTLYGSAPIRGVQRELIAVPIRETAQNAVGMRLFRRIRGSDGIVYVLYIRSPRGEGKY